MGARLLSSLTVPLFAGAAAAQPGNVLTLTVAGGPHAGRYTLASPLACSLIPDRRRGAGHEEFRGTAASADQRGVRAAYTPNALAQVGVRVPDLTAPSQVSIEVSFGDPMARPGHGRTPGTLYVVNTKPVDGLDSLMAREEGRGTVARKPSGRGGVTVRRSGATATVPFWGVTEAGVRIEGTFACQRVDPY